MPTEPKRATEPSYSELAVKRLRRYCRIPACVGIDEAILHGYCTEDDWVHCLDVERERFWALNGMKARSQVRARHPISDDPDRLPAVIEEELWQRQQIAADRAAGWVKSRETVGAAQKAAMPRRRAAFRASLAWAVRSWDSGVSKP